MLASRTVFAFLTAVLGASAALAQDTPPQHALPDVPPGAYHEWPGTPALATRQQTEVTDPDGDVIDSEGSGAIPALVLQPQTVGDITFITGGIGDEELAQLKATEPQYNLHLLLSTPHGAFISDVSLHLTDASGKEILAVDNAGPYFYAKLPAGSYTLALTGEGESKTLPIKIGSKGDVKKLVQFKEPGGVVTPHKPTASVDNPVEKPKP